jgi:hypothetical protein
MSTDVQVRMRRLMPSRVLARMATSGIYLVRGVPRDLQRAARVRAVREGTTLRRVLLQGLREYAAGTWTPKPEMRDGDQAAPPKPEWYIESRSPSDGTSF